ncbi:MAG: hypothetical protein MUE73_18570, partial [Planctomycetes bacterium]|nr:hypothetical protein [Planctomycetota bacterium]
MKLTILGGTLLVLFLPLAALAGSEEFYDWFGATDPGARRFVETMVKAGLAEEIHREIDPRMTPEAYLEVLDQIAAGDMEGVRPRLRPDGVRRLLRYITGGDRIVDMPDVPEVADAEWGRFARWADERDVSAFRTWLGERTERWRRMEEIGGLDTMEKMDRMFSQWWGRARNQIGQGRQRDRARYLARFEEAARRVALTRAAAFHRAAEDQRELRFAVLVKYIEIQDRIVAERARWAETRRALRRAGERDEDGTMALRYWSDAAFRREVDQKGRGRGESPLLTSGRLLGYAETATGELRSARKTLEKSKEALVVPVSTEALEKFRTDYAVILDAIVGNEVFWDEGRAALREWEKAEKDYTGLLSEIAQQYRRDAKKPKTGPDLAAQLSTEAETLEETLRQHEAGVGALRTERLAAAGPALAEVRAAAEGAQAQLRTRFFAGRYDAAHEQVSARAREGLAQTAAQRLGPSAEAGQFRDQAVGGRYDPAVAANYVRRGGKTPEEALSSMDGFLAAGVTGYEQETARLFTELEGMGSDDADLIRARVEAFRALEEAYYPRENLVAIATGEQGGRRDRRAEFDPDPERFWKEHIDQLVGLNLRRRNALESLRAQRVELANLVAFTAEAREDFAAGRRSLGYARELSEGAQAIARRAGGSGPVVLPPEATELVARPSLAADLREMVRRSGSARSLFDGRSSGYEKALAGTNRSSLGLDAPTYAPLRRSLAWHRSTLDALNRATTPAVPDLPRVQAEARELLAQYDALAGESPLVADGVLAAKREAEASLASLLGGGDANLAALVREYAAYVQAAEAQAAEDERTVDSYLAEAERALSFRGGSADDRLRVLNGGRATANLAARHLEAVKAYGLYAPEFSGHEQRLARFNSECDRLLAQVGPVDPVVFERRGSFHVIVNGISTRLMRPDIPNALNSADGTVEIRSDLYDAAFQGARKVLVRVDPEGATQPNWSVASTGTADFAIRATLSSPGVYVLDLRVVDRAGTGFA